MGRGVERGDSAQMTTEVAFVVDDISLANIESQLNHLGEHLSSEYNIYILYHSGESSSLGENFNLTQMDIGSPPQIPIPILDVGIHNLARVFNYGRKIQKFVRKNQIDVAVQFTNPPGLSTAIGVACLGTNTTAVYRYSGDSFEEYIGSSTLPEKALKYGYYNLFGRLGMNLCDEYIVLGENGAERLNQRGIPRELIHCIPPAISWSSSQTVETENHDIGLFVGRLSRMKGCDRLMEIIRKTVSVREDLEYHIIGEGEYEEKLSQLDQTHVHGYVPHDEVQQYYEMADFFVFPSRFEGLPNVALEAAACNTPIVSTPVGELSHFAHHCSNDTKEISEWIINKRYSDVRKISVDEYRPKSVSEQYINLIEVVSN